MLLLERFVSEHESLGDSFKTIEEHQGLKISCLEEIAYNNGWILKEQLLERAKLMKNNQYGFTFNESIRR